MFKYRLISGTILMSIVLSSLFIEGRGGAIVFTLLALVMLAGGMREFFYMTSKISLPGYSSISIFSAASPMRSSVDISETRRSDALWPDTDYKSAWITIETDCRHDWLLPILLPNLPRRPH